MLVAREYERKCLEKLYNSDKSELVALYGRRRIGKTFLIREHFDNRLTFHHAGMQSNKLNDQLANFRETLKEYNVYIDGLPKSWIDAFSYIKDIVNKSEQPKKVIFLDEISWMDTRCSGFIEALGAFWNNWCAKRKDILLILCSSVSSYVVENIIHNTGGLYNRLSLELHIEPFSLKEIEEYLISEGVKLDKKSITELYMCLGGIPYYYSFIEKGDSVPQYINKLFFDKKAKIRNEFEYIFMSQFESYKEYQKIMEVLSGKKNGYTREEIRTLLKKTNGGDLSDKLKVLEQCGYIREYYKMGQKKDSIFQLIDNFILFHNKFLKNKSTDTNFWINNQNSQTISSWQGLSFEIVALQHVDQIKEKLGIRGVYTNNYSYNVLTKNSSTGKGCQIDLVLDRADNIIDICEMKFSNKEYLFSKDDYFNITNKIENLKNLSKTKKAINVVLVTTYGLVYSEYSGYVDYVITLDDLFL